MTRIIRVQTLTARSRISNPYGHDLPDAVMIDHRQQPLSSFRGVYKRYLSGDVAGCEFSISLKRVTPKFYSTWVAQRLYSI